MQEETKDTTASATPPEETTNLPAVQEGGALAPTEVTDDMLMDDAGSGMEDVKPQDLMIPFIVILQSLSPQVKKKDPQYIEGAEEGSFFNTATQEIYPADPGIIIVPALYQRRHTEWIPRSKGGGLVADYGTDESCLKRATLKDFRYTTPEGHEIVISGTYFVLLVDPVTGAYEKAILPMAGTQLKKSRRWNTMITSLQEPRPDGKGTFNPASYYMAYHMTTVPESNEKGSWCGYQIKAHKRTLELPGGNAIYLEAKKFKGEILQGLVKVAPTPQDAAGGESGGDVPF